MVIITQWAIGFSIFALCLLGLAYLVAFKAFHKTIYARLACLLMLGVLTALQMFHWFAIQQQEPLLQQKAYIALLFLAPCSFYLFVREMLQPQVQISPVLVLHFLPAFMALFVVGPLAVTLAFLIGMAYGLWLCQMMFKLRDQRRYFKAEFYILIGFVVTALAALIVGLGAPIWGESAYVLAYANLTALFVATLLFLFLCYPGFGEKAEEAVQRSYAATTLKGQNTDALKSQLDVLLNEQKIYRHESLSLSNVAEQLGLSAHQLSELVNTAYGVGFSQLVRSCRVEEAKQLLLADQNASVLSIGMTVGFNSQSNFYTAFKEITGQTPGQFRQKTSK